VGQQIRQLIEKADRSADTMITCHIELDESYIGGRVSSMRGGRGAPNKTVARSHPRECRSKRKRGSLRRSFSRM
jgi:hypothetical protein